MKKTAVILMVALMGMVNLGASARKSKDIPSMSFVEAPAVSWQGDSLILKFSAIPEMKLKGMVAVFATPLYILGADTLRFPEIGIFSKQSYAYFKRREHYSRNASKMISYATKAKDQTPVIYAEYIIAPNNPDGRVVIQRRYENCCKTILQQPICLTAYNDTLSETVEDKVEEVVIAEVPVIPVLEEPDVTETVEETIPQSQDRPDRLIRETIALYINYHVGDASIDPAFRSNRQQLKTLDLKLVPLCDTATYRISKVYVSGYASPEGDFMSNLELSRKRAVAMRKYLYESGMLTPDVEVECEGYGEDWDGLQMLLEDSGKPWAKEAYDIINDYDSPIDRKQKIMRLDGGAPYNYMKTELFPRLRRIELGVDYEKKIK